jgi:PiT family inorganic phosphate transporter
MASSLSDLSFVGLLILGISLAVAFGFEFVNGFHDTSNAVATVIYTHSLKPVQAVVWSGMWNFLGVMYATTTGLAVAFSIVHLLPVELLVDLGQRAGLLMVASLLIAAVIWNLGTWYLGLPASSSHTLIGAVLGVGLAGSFVTGARLGSGVNWGKAEEVILSLLISPLIGFACAGLLLALTKRLVASRPELFEPPHGQQPPPWWIRCLLVFTCTGVSFAHGSNDGQKGIGLIMLVLIGVLPGAYAVNLHYGKPEIAATVSSLDELRGYFGKEASGDGASHGDVVEGRPVDQATPTALGLNAESGNVSLTTAHVDPTAPAILRQLEGVRADLDGRQSLADLPVAERWKLRLGLLQLRQAVLDYLNGHAPMMPASVRLALGTSEERLMRVTEYAPNWVPMGVALALGFGTMIGWKRIVVTVGEKIGKAHLSYAQGACAELTAMATIMSADVLGLPVSTTHVLSSGIAGTMVANQSGIQARTVRNIAAAWVLTLPVSMMLAGSIFLTSNAIAGAPRETVPAAVSPAKPQAALPARSVLSAGSGGADGRQEPRSAVLRDEDERIAALP